MLCSQFSAAPRQANVSILAELTIVELKKKKSKRKSGASEAAEAGKIFISEQQGRTFTHRAY